LHGDVGRNFRGREDDDAGDEGFEKAAEMKADGAVADQDGGAEGYAIADEMLEAFEDGAERDGGAAGGAITCGGERIDLALELLFDGGIQGEHFEFAVFAEEWSDERATHGLAAGFDEGDGALVDGGGFEQRFEDGGEIADGDLFAEELLQDALDFAEGEEAGDEFVDEFGLRLGEGVE